MMMACGRMTGIFKHAGFKVFSASSFAEALEVWGQHRGVIGLLVSDLVMPDGFGTDFAQMLKEQKPSVKTLLVSGHFPEELNTTFCLEEGVNFLQERSQSPL